MGTGQPGVAFVIVGEVTYRERLSVAWELTWRLVLGQLALLLMSAMVVVAFAAGARGFFVVLYGVFNVLMVWPFVLRRALPPQTLGLDPATVRMRYPVAIMFGIVVDAVSLTPVLAVLLLPHLRGVAVIAIGVTAVRLFVVLPLAIQALRSRAPTAIRL